MKNIIAFLFICILAASCERDVIIDVPAQPTRLVVNGITSVNSPFTVFVGKTAGILEQATPNTYKVSDALVELYEDNVLKDTLVYNPTANKYTVKRNTRAQTGRTYLLKVSAPGFTTAESQTFTPATVNIQSITRKQNVRTNANGNPLDELKISFTDDGAVSNNYLFKIKRPTYFGGGAMNYTGVYCMHSTDKDIERGNNADPTDFENCIDQEFFMTDRNFNGSIKEIIIYVDHSDLETMINPANNRSYKPVVELNNITADHYKYRKSYNTYLDSEDNPFAEPVLVFTNVKNGYGVFSTYAAVSDTIR
jgi:hypothetical protein